MTNEELIELKEVEKIKWNFGASLSPATICLPVDQFYHFKRFKYLQGKKEESDFYELKMKNTYVYNPEGFNRKVIQTEDEPETFDFYEAMRRVSEGKKVGRKSYEKGRFFEVNEVGAIVFKYYEPRCNYYVTEQYTWCKEELDSKDWYEAKEQFKISENFASW
jgi:hypothetical protein